MKKARQRSHPYRTWVEIDKKAIETNVKALREALSKESSMMAVVKSNAYGHGMVDVAKIVLKAGADRLAVDELSEALELRKAGIKVPILVLGYTLPELYQVAAAKGISLTISSLDSIKTLMDMKAGKKGAPTLGKKPVRIHIKFDTGLHRQGIPEGQVQQAIRLVATEGFPATIEGAYTHFAAMEDPAHQEYSRMQTDRFIAVMEQLRAKGLTPLAHASASSGILFSPEVHFDIARAGIALYGLWPSPEIRAHAEKHIRGAGKGGKLVLTPVLSWKTIVTEVKLVPQGAKIGYDLTYETTRDSRIAILPVGYWHGLPRSLSGSNGKPGGQVIIGGARVPIIGRISMDMTIVDVTDVPTVEQGDEVVIIGSQKRETVTADEQAALAGTISYELVTRINPLVPRVIL